jgi:hypothetical protein
MVTKRHQHRPVCSVAHNSISIFSAIVGYCDLLLEITESDSEYAKRVLHIREIAEHGVAAMKHHQREASPGNQKKDTRKAG